MKPELMTELFERAASEELGISIETNNPQRLIMCLGEHRRNSPGLWRDLTLVTPSTENTVFIVKNSVELWP